MLQHGMPCSRRRVSVPDSVSPGHVECNPAAADAALTEAALGAFDAVLTGSLEVVPFAARRGRVHFLERVGELHLPKDAGPSGGAVVLAACACVRAHHTRAMAVQFFFSLLPRPRRLVRWGEAGRVSSESHF